MEAKTYLHIFPEIFFWQNLQLYVSINQWFTLSGAPLGFDRDWCQKASSDRKWSFNHSNLKPVPEILRRCQFYVLCLVCLVGEVGCTFWDSSLVLCLKSRIRYDQVRPGRTWHILTGHSLAAGGRDNYWRWERGWSSRYLILWLFVKCYCKEWREQH